MQIIHLVVFGIAIEHGFLAAMLGLALIVTGFVGYLVYRVHRDSERIEGLTAAVHLQARRTLEEFRRSR